MHQKVVSFLPKDIDPHVWLEPLAFLTEDKDPLSSPSLGEVGA